MSEWVVSELTERRDGLHHAPASQVDAQQRRRRIRRTALVLALVAVTFYVLFIAMSVLGVRGP